MKYVGLNMLKPLPIGIQTFKDIIEGNYIYVDKTKYLYELIKSRKGVYFLSRPRRFGKSLLISTLKEIFEGNKELFKGLWIHNSDYEWQKYPVIKFDFSIMKTAETKEELKEKIILNLEKISKNYNIELYPEKYDDKFQVLLEELGKRRKVVILIDEYDAPIIQHITNIEKAREMREVLKGFYTVIKAMDEYIRFVLLTEVSKFSKAGVFSGLNNLNDITMDYRFATMLGITEEEVEKYLGEYIEEFARSMKMRYNEVLKKLRYWYNGYCFSKRGESVYNPFSILKSLDSRDFANYWFETGTPTFLVKLINERGFNISRIPVEVKESAFSVYELENLEILPLLFQTGYLTIKGYNEESYQYVLDYPNYEVKNSFLNYLLKSNTGLNGEQDTYLEKLIRAIKGGEIEEFFEILKRFFIDIPYDIRIRKERYYQSIFYLIFQIIGLRIGVEVKTDIGRIDAVVETEERVYIFEFKLRGSKEEALEQIKEKRCYEKYLDKEKKIYIIGVRFYPEAEEEYFDWELEEIEK